MSEPPSRELLAHLAARYGVRLGAPDPWAGMRPGPWIRAAWARAGGAEEAPPATIWRWWAGKREPLEPVAEQTHDEQDHGDHDQHVNPAAEMRDAERVPESERPRDEEDHDQRLNHED